MNQANSQLKKTVIRAPFDGVVGLKTISPGAYVRAGEDLVTLTKNLHVFDEECLRKRFLCCKPQIVVIGPDNA